MRVRKGNARTGAARVRLAVNEFAPLRLHTCGGLDSPALATITGVAGIIRAGSWSARLPSCERTRFAGHIKAATFRVDNSGAEVSGYSVLERVRQEMAVLVSPLRHPCVNMRLWLPSSVPVVAPSSSPNWSPILG